LFPHAVAVVLDELGVHSGVFAGLEAADVQGTAAVALAIPEHRLGFTVALGLGADVSLRHA